MRHVLLLLLVVAWSSTVSAQVVPTASEDRVVGTTADGKIAWSIQHLSVNRDPSTGEIAYPIVGPVQVEGRTLYAVRGDLFTLDVDAGRVIERQQYPAMISDLVVEDDTLMVELDIRDNSFGETTRVRTPFKPGFVPGRGPWETFAQVALRASADAPESLRFEEEFSSHVGKWTAQRQILKLAEERDPTNPMLPAYRGLAANADGDESVANAAFAQAIVAAGRWHEQLQVCGVLERARRAGLAESTCKAARETMVAAGLRPDAMLSLIAYVVATKDLRLAMEDAVAREDADAVHRIAGYTHDVFPNIEAGFMAFSALSDWFLARGDTERARLWEERSEAAMKAPATRAMMGRTRDVDHWLLVLAALFFALPIAGFTLGLRRVDGGEEESRWAWLPRPKILDGLVLAGLLITVLPLSTKLMSDVAAIGFFAETPIAALQEGYGSPNVVDWIDRMPEGPSRDRALAYARHELEAAKSGEPVTMEPPSPIDPLIALEEMAQIVGTQSALSFDRVSKSVGDLSVPNAVPLTFPGAFVFLLFAVVGRVTRRKFPRAADTLSLAVPGAHASFFAPVLVMVLFVGGLYLLTPLGTILQSIATPAFGRYFGLAALDVGGSFTSPYPMDRVWPWIAVIAALVVHVVTTFVARNARGNPEAAENP